MLTTLLFTLLLNQTSPAPATHPAAKSAHAARLTAHPASKPAARPAVKSATKPAARPAVKSATKPAARPAVKSASKPAARPEPEKTGGRVISGTATKGTSAPVRLINARSPERVVEGKKPDKRKIRPAEEKRPQAVHFPPMGIYNIHRQEFASIRVYDETGHLRPRALEEFNRIARCLHTGVQLPMDYRLLTEVYQAWLHFGMPSVTLFSGCRQAPYATPGSRHNFGLALDFNFDGVPRREVIAYFLQRREKTAHGMGVGYYPNSYHVHVDVRDKNAFWVDLQQGGEKGTATVADPMRWFLEENTRRRQAETTPERMGKARPVTAALPAEATEGGEEGRPDENALQ